MTAFHLLLVDYFCRGDRGVKDGTVGLVLGLLLLVLLCGLLVILHVLVLLQLRQ